MNSGNNAVSTTNATLLIIALSVTALAAAMFLPPIAQDPNYHLFADSRLLCGVSNFWNVLSNSPFVFVGVAGLVFLFLPRVFNGTTTFTTRSEWLPYVLFFIGSLLVGFGSAYYHYEPGNERLMWDRFPLGVLFMAMFSAVIAERVTTEAGKYLTLPLVLLGVGTVFNWNMTENLGLGDLRLYGVVQFFPMIAVPIILYKFPARYTHTNGILWSFGWYAAAKVFEHFDMAVYVATGISGHTIKHLLSGMCVYCILHMLIKRKPLATA